MLNLPSHEQLQDDPFGFRSASATRDKQESGRNPLPDTVGQDDPVTLPASRTPLAVDSPPQAQPLQPEQERTAGTLGAARARTQLPNTQRQPDNSAAQNATQGGSFSVRNLFAPGQYEALSQTMHDLVVHDPAGKNEPTLAQTSLQMDSTRASAEGVDKRNNAPMPASDPTKTIAKGRTLGPGLTLSQTESGEVAAFGPDGQVVDLKDKGVRSRFGLPDAPKTANPGTVLSESRPSPLTRKQLDVYNADRANGYTGRRDYISPFLTPDQQRARQGEIYAQRQADREAIAQRLATENTIADLESQRTGVPTTSARNRSMLPTSERVMGELQDRAAAEQVATQRTYTAAEKASSMRDTTTRRGQDIEDEISRRTAQDNAENRKTQERIAQINAGSKTQRDYQREAILNARSAAINAALSSDPKSVESPEFKKWLDETYPLMTKDELFYKESATGPDAKQYK